MRLEGILRQVRESRLEGKHCLLPTCGTRLIDSETSSQTCEFQMTDCELCDDKIFTKELEIHLADVCLEKKVVCPRGGKECGKYRRKDEAKHAASCCSYE